MQTRQSSDPRTTVTPVRFTPVPPGGAPPGADSGCDLVTVPTRHGLEAVDILRRGSCDAMGPVLHDDGCGTLGFVVPSGTAAAWDVPGSICTETDGRGLRLPPEPPVEGSDWLLPPGETDLATDPAVLRQALGEAARLIEAADNCR
ncbi:hypothetical protein [Streptomyces pseudovenezuelae]|uniref:Uncharacterized protein n=1 Tax=Streptomyces pseudovenezuelae TaxID=67350 RepID=A0ABT6LJU8_9ACTN|nr:hypothetical protein [Streptomyces pseudovenezuelae]MDH6215936.1 hypothetical protein [Streptomyces pseudovenezuelae]